MEIGNVSFSSRGLVREWRAESTEPPGRDLYLAETGGAFSGQGANSFRVLHGDDVAQDLHASRRLCGAFVGAGRMNPVVGMGASTSA